MAIVLRGTLLKRVKIQIVPRGTIWGRGLIQAAPFAFFRNCFAISSLGLRYS